MSSPPTVKALLKGLEVLRVLNLHDGTTVSEMARELGQPRTTVFRLLETLVRAGYAYRAASDDKYRLTILVRGLSDGFDDEAWITQFAKPYMYELGREIVWPVAIATLSGNTMLVRRTTDHQSPLAVEKFAVGFRVPLLGSAAGIAYLAWCPGQQRETLLELLRNSNAPEDKPASNRVWVERELARTRNRGYSIFHRERPISNETTFSVPVLSRERLLASLTVRFASQALSETEAAKKFVPRMRDVAQQIGEQFEEQHPSGQQ